MWFRRRGSAFLAAACLLSVAAGCSSFPDQASPKTWSPQEQPPPEQGPVPQEPGGVPGEGSGGKGQQRSSVPPPQGCKDFDPAVIGTCMSELSSVAALPAAGGQPSALVGERATGRVLQVSKGTDPTQIAKLSVSTTDGGGLLGLALSPTYDEDQQIYALISTANDNRVVRFAAKGAPKPVLTGIPRASTGTLALDRQGALLVATSDGGDAAAAKDEKSLAGKVLRLDADGKPAKNNPKPSSPVIASGVHSPGGVCASLDGKQTYVTDRAERQDAIYAVTQGKPLGSPLWTWPNRPGLGGCAVFNGQITITTAGAEGLQNLRLGKDGALTGKPFTTMTGKSGYGRFAGLDLATEQYAVGVTRNKAGGKPVSSDDRAVLILQQDGSGSGRD